MRRWINAAWLFALAAALSLRANGSFVYWTGLAFDDDWTTPSNWRGGVVPPNNGSANIKLGPAANVYGGTTYLYIGTNQNISTLNFTGALEAYDIWGGDGNTLTIQSGLTYSPSSPVDTWVEWSLNIAPAQNQTWNIASGSLEIDGSISGSATLTKTGAGELRLWGDNSGFSGDINLNQGGLFLGSLPGSGTLVINGALVPYLANDISCDFMPGNPVTLNGGSFQTQLHSPLTLSGTITLAADTTIEPQTREPLYLAGTVTGSHSLTVDGPGVVALTGTNSYTGGTVVSNGVLIFGAESSIPTTGLLKATGNGYIGIATPPDGLQTSFIDKFDKAGTTGTIGFDTGPDSEGTNDFWGPVDLTGFNAGARLGSATQAIFHYPITPQGSSYNFGGGGGWLEVDSYLTGANSVVVNSPAHAPLTVRLDPSSAEAVNDYTGGTTVTQSAIIFANPGGLPSTGSADLHLGSGGYIGLEDISSLLELNAYLARFPTSTSQGIIGFDSSTGGVTISNGSPINLNGFTTPTFYLGTATSATINDTISLPSTATAYRFAGYKGGQLEVASSLSDNLAISTSVIIGDPDVPATANDPTQANSTDLSTVILTGDNHYSGGTTLNAGQLTVGQSNVAGTTDALGTGALTVQPVSFTHDSSLRPRLEAYASDIAIPNDIVLNTDLEAGGVNNFTLKGIISGSGALYKIDGNTLTLAVDNTFSGGVHIGGQDYSGGTVIFNTDTAAGTGPLEIVDGAATFTTLHPVIHGLSGDDCLDPLYLWAGGAILTINQDTDSHYYGSIYESTVASLIKSGSGRLFLENSSSYSGGTTITDGTLIAGNDSALGSGTVTLSGGKLALEHDVTLSNELVLTSGKLGGYGTFASPNRPVIGIGVIIAPGANALTAPGTLSFGSNGLTFASDGTYNWQLQSVGAGEGIGWDLIDVAGQLNITATSGPSSPFTVKLISLDPDGNSGLVSDFDGTSSYSWLIASAAGGITNFNSSSFILDYTSAFQNPLLVGTFSLSLGDGDTGLYLNFTQVPEPSTYALMGLGLGVLWVGYRRRKSRLH